MENIVYLSQYLELGTILLNDPCMLKCVDEMRSMVRVRYSTAFPFCFAGGSSGLGKTQLAFTLSKGLSVIYIPFIGMFLNLYNIKIFIKLYQICSVWTGYLRMLSVDI